jgi:2-polyprenyl-3-methyl-5-hydroxy-6-metoxy-1,4-benzoquinol methylase
MTEVAREPARLDGACVCCGGRSHSRLFAKGGRDFVRCRFCGLVCVDPLPSPEELAEHYERSYREGGYAVFSNATEVRRMIAHDRLSRARAVARGERWLDVGCAGGEFVEAARGAGFTAEGIDLSSQAVARARARGLAAHHARFEDFAPERAYDTVTAFDLIEHTLEPRAFLHHVHQWLAPRGALVLTLPDVGSIYPRLVMQRHWFYYAPEEHLFYFDRRTIARLLAEEGFRVERIARAYKRLTVSYAAESLSLFNRTLGGIATRIARVLPRRLAEQPFSLYLGEMWVEAVKESG